MLTKTITYDQELLNQFEESIDPINPEHGRMPAQVLGYGEMSTVMTISGADSGLVFKRMPMFHTESELEPYLALYHAYLQHLTAAGVAVVPAAITYVVPSDGNVVVYIIQQKLDGGALLNNAIHALPNEDVKRLFCAILSAIGQVSTYNETHQGIAEVGFDAQMSNWAILDYQPAGGHLPDPVTLIYIDTSSPLLRLDGREQLDPELFLRSTPSFLRWLIRLFFMEDVMTRYYDHRQVIIDVLANLYKEKRVDVIPALLVAANSFLEERTRRDVFMPVSQKEVADYYKEDARIWTVYLAFRRLDRWAHRLLGMPYPYVLPGPVDR